MPSGSIAIPSTIESILKVAALRKVERDSASLLVSASGRKRFRKLADTLTRQGSASAGVSAEDTETSSSQRGEEVVRRIALAVTMGPPVKPLV